MSNDFPVLNNALICIHPNFIVFSCLLPLLILFSFLSPCWSSGNFARTDAQSMALVSLGVSQSLLLLLRQHSHKDGRIVVQHAALAALRNLTIAQDNKKVLLSQGALQVSIANATHAMAEPVHLN